jgi:putative (di)nucleoside polyphosphate hydrolase
MDIENRYFRAGVGTVIYNDAGEVLLFERAKNPVGVWQFQQGGIDSGESIKTTLWRELNEEVGLTEEDISDIKEYNKWTIHPYPLEIVNRPGNPNPDRLGQAHYWFFLKLKPETEIDLVKAHDQEFSQWKWTTFTEVIAGTADHKKPVYEELFEYFKSNIEK